MKKYFCFILCAIIFCSTLCLGEVFAEDLTNQNDFGGYYTIYSEEGVYLTERESVEVGDIIIDKNFNQYEIILVDEVNFVARAKFVLSIEKPQVTKNDMGQISEIPLEKTIGLYSTHNDESYIIGDGTSSVYGKGGIHDIAGLLGEKLLEKNIGILHDETLHIPHNSSAYSRSRATALALLKNSTAIFDIHRDGTSRRFYLTSNNGRFYSKIRIVIGQSNPNKDANLQFALWLVSVAEKTCPWLIADIYMGSGKYNQDLSSKALLFEMGTHEIEKEYVERSVPYLADLIFTTLFATNVDAESDELTIGEAKPAGSTVDEVLEEYNKKTNVLPIVLIGVAGVGVGLYFYAKRKKLG